jgi:hypothetical protein
MKRYPPHKFSLFLIFYALAIFVSCVYSLACVNFVVLYLKPLIWMDRTCIGLALAIIIYPGCSVIGEMFEEAYDVYRYNSIP